MSLPLDEMDITVRETPQGIVIELTGIVDLSASRRLRFALHDAVTQTIIGSADHALIVDLSQAKYVSRDALSELVWADRSLTKASRTLCILLPVSGQPSRIFSITGLDTVMTLLHPDRSAVRQSAETIPLEPLKTKKDHNPPFRGYADREMIQQ